MGYMLQDALIGTCVLWRTLRAVGSASLREVAHSFSATAEERKDESRWSQHEEKKEERDAYAGTRVLANLGIRAGARPGFDSPSASSKKIQREQLEWTASDKKCIHLRDEACAATQLLLRAMSWRQRLSLLSPGFTPPWESPGGEYRERASATTRGD